MLHTYYDYRLVAVSVFIAMFAAYAALGLAERVSAAKSKLRPLWIGGGACAMGTAIWSMHYIGMLAFRLPVTVHYDVPLVLLSMVAAILASAIALLFTCYGTSKKRYLTLAALAMGAGIASMHYIGMAAMRMRCTCAYDWRIVALSVVIAVVVSGVALASLRTGSNLVTVHKIIAAILLGSAISCMHYTGMAAAHFRRWDGPVDLSGTIGVSWLGGIGIAAGTLLLLGLAVVSSVANKRFSAQSSRLQSTEERYRLLFERSLAGIYRARMNGTIIDMNDACVELLGYKSREQVIGKIIRDVHLAPDAQKSYIEMLAENNRQPNRELRMLRADGCEIWVMASATIFYSQDGSPSEIQGMLLSIDELKRTERELRSAKHAADSANLAKSQFLANMSHELRTPLAEILGMSQVLMLEDLSSDHMECVDSIKTSAASLLTVIEGILEFSKNAKSDTSDPTEKFSLREAVTAEISATAATALSKGLTLQYDIAATVANEFWGKARWIRQVLSGLIGNAVKFTNSGEVAVNVSVEDTSTRHQLLNISVRDTGVGIPHEKLTGIFEPFNQVDNSNTRRFGGTGLGLAIVNNLVQAMNGHISVESELGSGSTFSVLLPLATEPEQASSSPDRKSAHAALEAEPVLTV